MTERGLEPASAVSVEERGEASVEGEEVAAANCSRMVIVTQLESVS